MAMESRRGTTFKAEEEERFRGLPPLKRFKILEKEKMMMMQDKHQILGLRQSEEESTLPTREEDHGVVCKVRCLPAKKRVCALQFSFSLQDQNDVDDKEHEASLWNKEQEVSSIERKALQRILNRQVFIPKAPLAKTKAWKDKENAVESAKEIDSESVVSHTCLQAAFHSQQWSTASQARRGEPDKDKMLVKKKREVNLITGAPPNPENDTPIMKASALKSLTKLINASSEMKHSFQPANNQQFLAANQKSRSKEAQEDEVTPLRVKEEGRSVVSNPLRNQHLFIAGELAEKTASNHSPVDEERTPRRQEPSVVVSDGLATEHKVTGIQHSQDSLKVDKMMETKLTRKMVGMGSQLKLEIDKPEQITAVLVQAECDKHVLLSVSKREVSSVEENSVDCFPCDCVLVAAHQEHNKKLAEGKRDKSVPKSTSNKESYVILGLQKTSRASAGCHVSSKPVLESQVLTTMEPTEKSQVIGMSKQSSVKGYANKDQESDGEDDVLCDVCKEADAEPSDPIVFCDGCNVMVHASCYGRPLMDEIPEDDWFCRQCESDNRKKAHNLNSKGTRKGQNQSRQQTVPSRKCCLCPGRKGAMKQTTGGAWAHLSCALFVPEVFYKQARDREGIECGSVPAWRWQLPCIICSKREGACIQCTEVGCTATFHVSCGLDAGLTIDYRNANVLTKMPAIVIAFCPSHTRQSLSRSERRRFKIVPRD